MDAPVSAKAAILQALVQGPGYGADIVARVRQATGGMLELSEGSVYPALRALERAGMVESAGVESRGDRGGRPRELFRLTDRGRAEAERHRAIMVGLMAMADDRRGRCGTVVQERAPNGHEPTRWVERDGDEAKLLPGE